MELYACGFNAWNQLFFTDDLKGIHEEEPRDLLELQCVLRDKAIQVLRAGFSNTLVQTPSGLRLAGMPDELANRIHEKQESASQIVEAGNGKVAYAHSCDDGQEIHQYNSWADYPNHPDKIWKIRLPGVKRLVAGQTFFTALTADAEVLTWGDERYSACLGREIARDETSSSASSPSPIPELSALPTGPIIKVCSGGYITAALTEGRDLYLWGVGPPGHSKLQLSSEPTPLDLHGLDVLDVGTGDGHVIILTTNGDNRGLWVIGEGRNGQLGLGDEVEEVVVWRELDLKMGKGREMVGVVAGPKASFVLVKITQPQVDS